MNVVNKNEKSSLEYHLFIILMQVYMASIFENQYKLLARAGNKVQEVKTF